MTTTDLDFSPVSATEQRLVKRALRKLYDSPHAVPHDELIAELVHMGLPTPERADLALKLSSMFDGPPKTVLGTVIAYDALTDDTPALSEQLAKYVPDATPAEVIAELDRQMAARRVEQRSTMLVIDIAKMLGCEPDAPMSTVLENLSPEDQARVDAFTAAREAEWELQDAEEGGVALRRH